MLFIESPASLFLTEGIVCPEGRLYKLQHSGVGHVGVHTRHPLVALEAVAHKTEEVELVIGLIIADQGGPTLSPAGVLIAVIPSADLTRLWSPVPNIFSLELWPQLPNTFTSVERKNYKKILNTSNYVDSIGRSTSLCLSRFVPQDATQQFSLTTKSSLGRHTVLM